MPTANSQASSTTTTNLNSQVMLSKLTGMATATLFTPQALLIRSRPSMTSSWKLSMLSNQLSPRLVLRQRRCRPLMSPCNTTSCCTSFTTHSTCSSLRRCTTSEISLSSACSSGWSLTQVFQLSLLVNRKLATAHPKATMRKAITHVSAPSSLGVRNTTCLSSTLRTRQAPSLQPLESSVTEWHTDLRMDLCRHS